MQAMFSIIAASLLLQFAQADFAADILHNINELRTNPESFSQFLQ
jgi:hypothetical protein